MNSHCARWIERQTHLWSLIPAALEPLPPRGWYDDMDWGGKLCGWAPACGCRGPEMSFWGCCEAAACWLVEPTWTDRIAASISFRRRHLFHDFLARILSQQKHRGIFSIFFYIPLFFLASFFWNFFLFIQKLHNNEKKITFSLLFSNFFLNFSFYFFFHKKGAKLNFQNDDEIKDKKIRRKTILLSVFNFSG